MVIRFPAPHSKAEHDPDVSAFHLAWARRACALTAVSTASPTASLLSYQVMQALVLTSAAATKIYQDGVLKAYWFFI